MIDLLLGMFIEELTVIKKKTPETGDYGIVSKIVEYISLNFANELSIEKVAEDLNYNKYYISKSSRIRGIDKKIPAIYRWIWKGKKWLFSGGRYRKGNS